MIDCTIVKNEYGYNCVLNSAAHRTVCVELLAGVMHEPETIEYILANRGDGIVIHAGAFIGDMLPALSGKGKRLYAFEPGDEFFRCARITMDLNFAEGEHSTILINKGLGDKVVSGVPLLSKESEELSEGGGSRILRTTEGVEDFRYEDIQLTTIDLEVRDIAEVSLIHLDVEGFEEQALRGGETCIRVSKPILLIEVGRDDLEVESDYINEVIFGELGYIEVDRFRGNRAYKPKEL
jgi:FkbM family methyltransferase